MTKRKKPVVVLPSPQQVGREFAAVLWDWAHDPRLWDGDYADCESPLQLWRAMRKNNSKYGPNDGICCSGDWCDSNMAMDAALRNFGLDPLPDDDSGMSDAMMGLWNAAWDYAAVRYLGRRATQ